MRRHAVALAAALMAVGAGCGVGTSGPVPAGPPASGLRAPGSVRSYAQVYFVGPYGVQAVARRVTPPLARSRRWICSWRAPTRRNEPEA
ncbi:hypothetical protein ACFYM2_12195 [Streptomyces sp. NPDC006711]|uniref:hypothetical protein n=1 Tax=unclassified Streptomyces TaxID=2593676 RepID=UPI0036A82A8D